MCIASITGDIIGSPYEGRCKPKDYNFPLFTKKSVFTDDSILSLAVADAVINKKDYAETFKEYYEKYPYGRYGKNFRAWAKGESTSNNSCGNGAAMRISALPYVFSDQEELLEEVKKETIITHNSPQAISGAQAIALAIFLAKNGATKEYIKKTIVQRFKYDLNNIPIGFKVSCQESVPQALDAFFRSENFIDAIRKAILVNGDSDTLAAMTGSIAMPFYGDGISAIPSYVMREVFRRLPNDLAEIAIAFIHLYIDSNFIRPARMSLHASFLDLYRSIFDKI
jgi:ADP-ribosylglycohydrolase